MIYVALVGTMIDLGMNEILEENCRQCNKNDELKL